MLCTHLAEQSRLHEKYEESQFPYEKIAHWFLHYRFFWLCRPTTDGYMKWDLLGFFSKLNWIFLENLSHTLDCLIMFRFLFHSFNFISQKLFNGCGLLVINCVDGAEPQRVLTTHKCLCMCAKTKIFLEKRMVQIGNSCALCISYRQTKIQQLRELNLNSPDLFRRIYLHMTSMCIGVQCGDQKWILEKRSTKKKFHRECMLQVQKTNISFNTL